MIAKRIGPQQALKRLEDLCSRSEQSTGELMQKMRRWALSSAEIDKIINHLKENRFVDDARFARAFVNDKVNFARWGRRKITAALSQKGVPSNIVSEAIDNIDDDAYLNNAIHLALLKIKARPELTQSFEARTKIFRYLLSRGYESAVASTALKTALAQSND